MLDAAAQSQGLSAAGLSPQGQCCPQSGGTRTGGAALADLHWSPSPACAPPLESSMSQSISPSALIPQDRESLQTFQHTQLGCLFLGAFMELRISPPKITSPHSFSSFPNPCECATSPTAVVCWASVPFLLYMARTCYHLLQPWAGSLTVYAPSQLYRIITFQNSTPKPKLLVSLSETENFGSWGCWWPEAIPSEYNTDRAWALTVIYCALKT